MLLSLVVILFIYFFPLLLCNFTTDTEIAVTPISFPLACNDIHCRLILTEYAIFLSDIDECSRAHPMKMKECHPNASCINTQGSYYCSCHTTFTGNGIECKGMLPLSKTS